MGPIRTSAYLLTPHLVRSDEPVPIAPLAPAPPPKKALQQASDPASISTNDPASDDIGHPAPPAPKRANKEKDLSKNKELKNTELASYVVSPSEERVNTPCEDLEIEPLLADIQACLANANCAEICGLPPTERTVLEIAAAFRSLSGDQRKQVFESLLPEWTAAGHRARGWGLIVRAARDVCGQVAAGSGVARQRSVTWLPVAAPFPEGELRQYLMQSAHAYRSSGRSELQQVADALDTLAAKVADEQRDLETLESKLATLESQALEIIRPMLSPDARQSISQAVERELRPYAKKMSADHLDMLRARYLDAAVLDSARVPRLSLFYVSGAA